MNEKKIINIGLMAHVDAGKTTITEQMLLFSGAVRHAGSVDKGTSVSDFMEVEKQRGISVQSTPISFETDTAVFNLIDTPGHVDFSSEVEQSLMALDGAVLILSAVEGLQAHTETLWDALDHEGIPVILCINKIDRMGADSSEVINDIKRRFTDKLIILSESIDEGSRNADVRYVWDGKFVENPPEWLIEEDDELLENFLENDDVDKEKIKTMTIDLFRKRQLFPVVTASAIQGIGVDYLIEVIEEFFPDGRKDPKDDFSARIFHIHHDAKLGRLAFVKMVGGSLSSKTDVLVLGSQAEKIHGIYAFTPGKYQMKQEIRQGEIAALTGIRKCQAGDWLGKSQGETREAVFSVPVLRVRVYPSDISEISPLLDAMEILNDENPALNYTFRNSDNEIQLSIMGYIQQQVLESILFQRFGLKVFFGEPTVIFKETPKKEGVGRVEYTMPKPCWAVMTFKVKPGDRGSGVRYTSTVSGDKIASKYQNEVSMTIEKALAQGPLGWQVTDISIELVDGEDHTVHSNPGDFKIATPMGIMDALVHTETEFLEPVNRFRIVIPEEFAGKTINRLVEMRGEYDTPVMRQGELEIRGVLPVSTSLNFPLTLNADTGGRGRLSARFHEYRPCKKEFGVIRPFDGINPLDRSKYILHARQAL